MNSELKQFPTDFNFAKNEEEIVKMWRELNLYQLWEEQNKSGELFRFMDGPPFVSSANLHYGHIHISACKSVVTNYQRMCGRRVLNKLGYDCHGLPIEMVANVLLGVKTRADVLKMGVDKYNQACRDLIKEYSGSWEHIYERVGRQLDFKNVYKTMDFPFMESVWWCFKQLWNKGLVYRAFKIMPYSTGAQTPLSNSESSEDYKMRQDPALYVKFQDREDSNVYYVAWTTTPWTLPSNLALCVNPEFNYVKIQDKETGEIWVVGEDNCDKLYQLSKKQKSSKENRPYEVVDTFKGTEIVGRRYQPLFSYFDDGTDNRFKILGGAHVTAESGTGIVHTAPAFGEEDFNVCVVHNIVTPQNICDFGPVDDSGVFTAPVNDFVGVNVFEANEMIITRLKQEGKIVKKEVIEHSYPYCGRTKTPLIYRAVSSYFIAVTQIKEELIKNNQKVNWIPKHIGENRFGLWLANTRDWGVSRSRFFGTPLPIWVSDDGEESVCIGSVEELEELTGTKVSDLHPEVVGKLTVPSKLGKGELKNCGLVFDCWFESGCVPFGQIHYPFENRELLENQEYLSDFICEGVDQTRGWFYTLMVLSTAIMGKPAFKNVICAGLILAEDGKKFAKRLNNFIPPEKVLSKYGADSVRLYLTQTPAAHADAVKFAEGDIENILRKLVQWLNGCKFFIEHYTKFTKDGHQFDPNAYLRSTNVTDHWIISRVGTLVSRVRLALDNFEVYRVTQEILDLIEDLTNWYIKFNRNRVRGRNCSVDEQTIALSTLWHVYLKMSVACAPVMPFLSDAVYNSLKSLGTSSKMSVMLESYPKENDFVQDLIVERKMKRMQQVAGMIRQLRSTESSAKVGATSVKMPVKRAVVAHEEREYIEDIQELERYLKEEVNVLQMEYRSLDGLVTYRATVDSKKIGMKYRQEASAVREAISKIPSEELQKILQTNGNILVQANDKDYNIERDEVHIQSEISMNSYEQQEYRTDGGLCVLVDFQPSPLVMETYQARIFVTTVQHMRKETLLRPWNKIKIYYDTPDKNLIATLDKHREKIVEDLIYDIYPLPATGLDESMIVAKDAVIDGSPIKIIITDPTGELMLSSVE